jgi:hypothetical protein
MYALYRKLLGDDLYLRTKEHVQAYTFASVTRLLETRFAVTHVQHVYHALGHLMDATFFAAAALPRLNHFWWRENRYYAAEGAAEGERTTPLAFVLNRMLALGNAVAYLESRVMARSRVGAAGMLFEARRGDS